MKLIERWWVKSLGPLAFAILFWAIPAYSHDDREHATVHDHGTSHHLNAVDPTDHWEGSLEGKAYSNFNHHLAGVFIILIGLSEVHYGIAASVLPWTRFLLPVFMVSVGVFLLIWSDHEGWPFGSTFSQAFFTGEWETIQHKWFGMLAFVIGLIEWLRRTEQLRARGWKFPLPAFAIVGGLSLFLHSHGANPLAHKIAVHHAIMGIMAVTAGSSKFLSDWKGTLGAGKISRWELAWAALVLLIGIQLLIYSE